MKCGECFFWFESTHPEDIKLENGGCFRYPPHPKCNRPKTYKNHFCGEFKPKSVGLTNDDKPFERGEIIEYASDRFSVLNNYGDMGDVKEYPDGDIVQRFYWTFECEKCKRVIL